MASRFASRSATPSRSATVSWSASLVALCALAAGAATVRGPATVESLTASSDLVVRARVSAARSAWGDGGARSGAIFTTVTLSPTELWKRSGAAQVGAQVLVLTPGGSVGEWDQTVHGAPAFREGEEVVVFLKRRASTPEAAPVFEVQQWALGKFAVTSSKAGMRAARDRTGLTCVGCGADEADELALDELRGRVLAAARERK
jgi:hypothetical protein